MRIFKGLENIHAVIDKHEIEWRKEQGEPVDELSSSYSIDEAVRRRSTVSEGDKHGRFDPNRFLGGSSKKKSAEKNENENENQAEIISVIKQQDGKPHSWLYNEVVKAINDAAGNDKNVKVIAVFVPVVQNGKEFEELPVNESVTLPPVNEEEEFNAAEFLQEPAPLNEETEPEINEDFNLLPESQEHPDEELAEAFTTMEEKLDEALEEEHSQEQEPEQEHEIEIKDAEPLEEILEPEETQNNDFEAEVETPENEIENENENNEIEKEEEISEVQNDGGDMQFDEFPVLTDDENSDENDENAESFFEDVTSDENNENENDSGEEEQQEQEQETELEPLDDIEENPDEFDTEVFEEPAEAIKKLDEIPEDDDEKEIINLDFKEE